MNAPDTPICDFVDAYIRKNPVRLHMPGHKGHSLLGCERADITEIDGADELYLPSGIIRQSEENASALFGTARTCYSAEGSSLAIRAMLRLACYPSEGRPLLVAARNAHKAFLYAAALLDCDIAWLWPEQATSLCSCAVSAAQLSALLTSLPKKPAAVYLTSPDYLGGTADIASLARTAHDHGVPLLVDNAHGAYLHFLPTPVHPIDLGADLCCDSAHKTLPVLTGGAYLHFSSAAPKSWVDNAENALALFGSTSPSYLILQSLDAANRYLADGYPARLAASIRQLQCCKERLSAHGWRVLPGDPLRLTLHTAPDGLDGRELSKALAAKNIFCEYADPDYLVGMFTPENDTADIAALESALTELRSVLPCHVMPPPPPLPRLHTAYPVRTALLARSETVLLADAVGRILASPTVSCPPAVPIAVSGERLDAAVLRVFAHYGYSDVNVMQE